MAIVDILSISLSQFYLMSRYIMNSPIPSTPTKILIIPSWYPNYKGDIGGSFFREQAIALNKKGYSVSIIYPQIRTVRDLKGIFTKRYGFQKYIDEGVFTYKWHSVNFIVRSKKALKKKWIKFGLYLFNMYIRDHGLPHIIHVHSMRYAGFLALEIKKIYGVPYIITEHSSAYALNLVKKFELTELQSVVDYSDYNIAVSKRFCKLLNTLFRNDNWHFLPNIVEDSFLSLPLSSSSQNFNFLSVSALKKNKSIDNLIKAFSLICDDLDDTNLIIGGDGPEYGELYKLINQLNLSGRVRLLGQLDRNTVKHYMSNCSVFILPSKYETFGVVVIEALAAGKPVIATRSGGPESTINEQVGILVDTDDIEGLALAMRTIYNNYCSYSPEHIRSYCYHHFSENSVLSALDKIYNIVLSANKYKSLENV